MRRPALFALAALVLAPATRAQLLPAFGTDRGGTVGFQFLKLPSDARALGMGNAGVTTATDASALYWNPALAAQASGMQVAAGRAAYYSGPLFTTNFAGVTAPLGGFTVGASLLTLDSGPMDVTTEFNAQGTGETFRFVDVAAGLSVAQQLTDLFSYGVTVRYVRESTAEVATQSGAADLGIFYRIGQTGARMGVAIKNFGLDAAPQGAITVDDPTAENGVRTETTFESITMPTTFLLGLSYDAWQRGPHAVVVNAQLARPNDNAESLGLSGEYTFGNVLALRGGTRFGAGDYAGSAGGSLHLPLMGRRASIDYGFARYSLLGNVHALGLRFGM